MAGALLVSGRRRDIENLLGALWVVWLAGFGSNFKKQQTLALGPPRTTLRPWFYGWEEGESKAIGTAC
jgi:hypothetical protein